MEAAGLGGGGSCLVGTVSDLQDEEPWGWTLGTAAQQRECT